MANYKQIPIRAAARIAKEFDKDQVFILTWDKAYGRTHVTTYGKTIEDCKQAAEGGNELKRNLGWPEELCKAAPPRAKPDILEDISEFAQKYGDDELAARCLISFLRGVCTHYYPANKNKSIQDRTICVLCAHKKDQK